MSKVKFAGLLFAAVLAASAAASTSAQEPGAFDALSIDCPPDMVSQYPSVTREKASAGWSPDGKITKPSNGNLLAEPGDLVDAAMAGGQYPAPGTLFAVYQRDGIREGDQDTGAVYLVRIGEIQAVGPVSENQWLFKILKSGDVIEGGELVKRESGDSEKEKAAIPDLIMGGEFIKQKSVGTRPAASL